MAETVATFLEQYLSPEVIIFLISLLPILELRGGLIAATLLGVPWVKASIICIIGNIIPVPFIILFIDKILKFLSEHGPIKRFARFCVEKGNKGGTKLLEKYPKSLFLGLFMFTAIPLPGTGAWTASLVAGVMGIKPKKSAPPIGLGVLGAWVIMSIITYGIPMLMGVK